MPRGCQGAEIVAKDGDCDRDVLFAQGIRQDGEVGLGVELSTLLRPRRHAEIRSTLSSQ